MLGGNEGKAPGRQPRAEAVVTMHEMTEPDNILDADSIPPPYGLHDKCIM